MKFLKTEKGIYKYISKQRIIEIIRTIFMFACAIILYLIGFVTLKTNKNIWTILAVLSVLPAAKSCVSMIMFIRFSSIDETEYQIIEKARGNIDTMYELVFTTSEKSYFVKNVCCANSTIVMLYDNRNKKDLSKELKTHIMASIEREGLKGYSLKIYTDTNSYIDRLSEMNNNLDNENDNSSGRVFALFKAITI